MLYTFSLHACTDYDCVLHVNPHLDHRGLAMIFNPTPVAITRNISLPLYYTGLSDKALVLPEGQSPGAVYGLDRGYNVVVTVTMDPKSITWILIMSPD